LLPRLLDGGVMDPTSRFMKPAGINRPILPIIAHDKTRKAKQEEYYYDVKQAIAELNGACKHLMDQHWNISRRIHSLTSRWRSDFAFVRSRWIGECPAPLGGSLLGSADLVVQPDLHAYRRFRCCTFWVVSGVGHPQQPLAPK
jgi:hypothetical protein